jgi:L-alanine-DL-glutamate epimerase-like enolase superfamily enzyme
VSIERLETSVFDVPTDLPGGDGTATWDSTTMVLVEAVAESGQRGLGYTYGAPAAAALISEKLAELVRGRGVDDVRGAWHAMVAAVRNAGRPGVAATAISAVDMACWDLKAKVAGQSLSTHLGACRSSVPIYGSGGLTTYTETQLVQQLQAWVEQGIPRVKMKIGKDRGESGAQDLERVAAVRSAIGADPALFVDANGAYTGKQAVRQAEGLAGLGVSYFEEPVSSDRPEELARVRRDVPMDVAAGEYGWDPWCLHALLRAGAVDILQADATRCLGVTGWLMAADLAFAAGIPFSAHCSPTIHAHLGCVAPQIAHLEYFHDHARLEGMVFEGVPALEAGTLSPDPRRAGLGLEVRWPDAARFQVAATA